MYKKIYLFSLLSLFFFIPSVFSQISQGGQPYSFDNNDKSAFDSETLAEQKTNELIEEAERLDGMYKMGIQIQVAFSPENAGTWKTLANGDRLWRLEILSDKGAKALNPYFDKFYLPEGSKLYLYNKDRTQILGSYTSQNNPESGFFAISPIHDDNFTIEYFEPAGTKDKLALHIHKIGYAFRGVQSLKPTKAFGSSASCEVNANCSPEGDGWQTEKKSVAKIIATTNAGMFYCTGSMINNVREDCTNYFLTAMHCALDGVNLTTAANLNQWIFFFNYEAPNCVNPGSEGTLANQSLVGATAISHSDDGGGDSGSDFLLLEFNTNPPTAYDVYYAGWNNQNVTSNNGVGIHHPAGDIKKISTYTTNLVSSQWGTATGSHWGVVWQSTANGHGVTEGGSSGSAIYNSNGHIIGTLTGGGSSCTAVNSADAYGKMSYHWTSNGSAANRQLAPWLDPDGTGVNSLNGKLASTCGMTGGGSCDPLTGNYDLINDTPTLLGASVGGYVSGHNGYGDIAKADYFQYTGVNTEIESIQIGFGLITAANTTSTFNITLWDGTGGVPGNVISQNSETYESIANLFAPDTFGALVYTFATPVQIPASKEFFIGIEFDYSVVGDTVAMITNTDLESIPATAWELFSDGTTWVPYDDAGSWGISTSHYIFYQTVCDDDCPPILAVDDAGIPDDLYQAGVTLTSKGQVLSGSTVDFRAGTEIILQQDFEAENMTTFEADIEPCPTPPPFTGSGVNTKNIKSNKARGILKHMPQIIRSKESRE